MSYRVTCLRLCRSESTRNQRTDYCGELVAVCSREAVTLGNAWIIANINGATDVDSLFGVATVRNDHGHLSLSVGLLQGDLEQWQYDLFRVHWRQSLGDPDYVAFTLSPDGTVGELRFRDGPQHYQRVR